MRPPRTLAELVEQRLHGGKFPNTAFVLSCIGKFWLNTPGYIVIPVSSDDQFVAVHGLEVIIAYHPKYRDMSRRIAREIIKAQPDSLLAWRLDTGTFHAVMEFGVKAEYSFATPQLDLVDEVDHIVKRFEGDRWLREGSNAAS